MVVLDGGWWEFWGRNVSSINRARFKDWNWSLSHVEIYENSDSGDPGVYLLDPPCSFQS